ncbi:MAG: argininosuccinate synthase domain-containing protein, partial [bacterium]
MVKKVVLAYSGGLDTSIMAKWIKDKYNCEVIAYCADVGQAEELDSLDERGKRSGASKVIIDDLKKPFVENFIFPMLKSGAIYESKYLLGTSIARPIIAKGQVEAAKREGADAVAHG